MRNRAVGTFFLVILIAGAYFFLFWKERGKFGFDDRAERMVWVSDDGLRLPYVFSGKKTVEAFLKEKKLSRGRADEVTLPLDRILFGGEEITVYRDKEVEIAVGGGEKKKVHTVRKSAQAVVTDEGVMMEENDFILPSPDAVLRDGLVLEVVRVVMSEEVEKSDIAFETKSTEDNDLGWRIKKVAVKGEKGTREKKYKVVSHNGKTVKKTLVSNEIVKNPVTEEIVQGTYVKTGKKHTGQGTWYTHTGTLAAASPWLPMGSYAKVTNQENGKSVIVKINDRGPFGKGRIIDLDKVAFAKIASVGAGVIGVTVEEVLN